MRKYYSFPLLFFLLAAILGLFLRFQFIRPTPGIRYTYFLHSHSHIMFLGWVFNVLYLSFIGYHIPEKQRHGYLTFFLWLQVPVAAMMISFPIQGYGLYSIIFSTVHTLAVMVFTFVFYSRTKDQKTVSLWFAKMGLFFFFLSTAGPFSLGYLMSHGLGQTHWYNFSIYYYLHFQYNGFFLFGVLSLFYQMLERKQIRPDARKALVFGKRMAVACVLTYPLSILFARPGLAFNAIGAAGALVQLIAIGLFLKDLRPLLTSICSRFLRSSRFYLTVVAAAMLLKALLQLASAEPGIAELAYHLRPVVIAYLHLVLIGVITLSMLVWFLETKLVNESLARKAMAVLLVGFAGSEMALVVSPWWANAPASVTIFVFSAFLPAGIFIFYRAFLKGNPDKSQHFH
ncbi:MAG TPA: hypothetical protein VF490_06955 [Chryseosolibacter sp.]